MTIRHIKRAEAAVAKLVDCYRGHGCSDAEIEQMDSIIKARQELAFQRDRTPARSS